ncbi:MAG: hypothetical protein WCJ18_05360, partial [Planctomycetota bacterium]
MPAGAWGPLEHLRDRSNQLVAVAYFPRRVAPVFLVGPLGIDGHSGLIGAPKQVHEVGHASRLGGRLCTRPRCQGLGQSGKDSA